VGPVRVTQAGLLSPESVKREMFVALASALAVGTYLVWVGGWPIVAIGLASLACAVGYTAGPFPLAYHGLGDVFVFVFFGLVAVSGTYYVQALHFTNESFLAGAGIGALSTAILVVNNLRDRETDARAGKRTLAVRMGVGASRAEYVALLVIAAVVPIAGTLLYDWPALVLAASLAIAMAVGPASAVLTFRGPHDLIPALGETARVVAMYGVLLGGAFLFS
jgi:1,4-dihydroxy-2-naphthoate octaprenyltransferase